MFCTFDEFLGTPKKRDVMYPTTLKYAQEKAWSVKVMQQAFARTGLYPLDKNAIDKSYIKPHTNQEEADLSGLWNRRRGTGGAV